MLCDRQHQLLKPTLTAAFLKRECFIILFYVLPDSSQIRGMLRHAYLAAIVLLKDPYVCVCMHAHVHQS